MDINTTILTLVAVLSTLFGVLLPFAYFSFKAYQMRKEAMKKMQKQVPMIGPEVSGTTCDSKGEKHEWVSVPIVKQENFDPNNPEPQDTLVCMKCGSMSGTKQQFTPDGLEVLKRNMAEMEERKAFAEEMDLFRKRELERRFYDFMERTVLPDGDEARKSGFYKKLYDLGIQSTEEVSAEISLKIQKKQQEKAMEMMRRLYESNSNV